MKELLKLVIGRIIMLLALFFLSLALLTFYIAGWFAN